MKPILTEEELAKIDTESKPQHQKYLQKLENLPQEIDKRMDYDDWQELYMNEETGV